MKTLLIVSITFYHRFLSPLLLQLLGIKGLCRYNQSCSVYTIEAIKTHGARRGIILGVKRVLSCQPFTKPYATT